MGDIQKRLDNVRQMIQSQDFLEGKGLSNEVNIRIFCYEPRDEMAVRHFIEQLSTDMTLGCQFVSNLPGNLRRYGYFGCHPRYGRRGRP